MKKRFRDRWLVNLGLLIGIGLLALILILGEETPPPPATTLASLLPSNINTITLIRSGKETILFEKKSKSWNMLKPYPVPADVAQINMLLALENFEISAELDSNKIMLADFGLEQPESTVRFNTTQLKFGASHTIGKRRYIQIGNKVMLIPDNLDAQLNTSSVSFIDRHLIPAGKTIERLEISDNQTDSSISPEIKQKKITDQWQTIKANWISHGTNNPATGINIKIKLIDQEQPLLYLAEQRDADLVLIRNNPRLEYHLPKTAIKVLGLRFPTIAK